METKVKRQWICVSQDFSGLGFCKLIQDTGDDVFILFKNDELDKPEEKKSFKKVSTGIVDRFPLEDIWPQRKIYKNAYWIFDTNYLSEYSDTLRKEGFKVLGAWGLTYKMEHDRKFAVQIANKYGLQSPPTFPFTDVGKALKFLDANKDRAYVFKPDDAEESHLTFVPEFRDPAKSNREVYDYIQSLQSVKSFILQEKMRGVEANFEIWFYKGTPCFAFCGLENKRKLNGDLGEQVGCAHDVVFKVPLNSRGVQETIGKLAPFYKEQNYTGFADVNVIIADNQNWFLEVCNRFGYNAHPNLFMSLAIDSFPNIIADFLDGKIMDIDKRFRNGFGDSLMLYHDHPRIGQPLYVPEEIAKDFYCFDYYQEDEKFYLAGYYDIYVGIISAHGYTIQDAGKEVIEKANKISFPDIAFRSDIDKHELPNSPIKRYQALQSMGYVK